MYPFRVEGEKLDEAGIPRAGSQEIYMAENAAAARDRFLSENVPEVPGLFTWNIIVTQLAEDGTPLEE